MAGKACADTGPIIHLTEIKKTLLLKTFENILLSDYVKEELSKHGISKLPQNIQVKEVNKDQVALLNEKYGLDLGESSAIWMCKSFRIGLLLTDDLDAREISASLGIKPVGTIGIVTRALREGAISKEDAINTLKLIKKNSSLFVTSQLIEYSISEIKKFKKA